jgi:hypothetical protein
VTATTQHEKEKAKAKSKAARFVRGGGGGVCVFGMQGTSGKETAGYRVARKGNGGVSRGGRVRTSEARVLRRRDVGLAGARHRGRPHCDDTGGWERGEHKRQKAWFGRGVFSSRRRACKKDGNPGGGHRACPCILHPDVGVVRMRKTFFGVIRWVRGLRAHGEKDRLGIGKERGRRGGWGSCKANDFGHSHTGTTVVSSTPSSPSPFLRFLRFLKPGKDRISSAGVGSGSARFALPAAYRLTPASSDSMHSRNSFTWLSAWQKTKNKKWWTERFLLVVVEGEKRRGGNPPKEDEGLRAASGEPARCQGRTTSAAAAQRRKPRRTRRRSLGTANGFLENLSSTQKQEIFISSHLKHAVEVARVGDVVQTRGAAGRVHGAARSVSKPALLSVYILFLVAHTQEPTHTSLCVVLKWLCFRRSLRDEVFRPATQYSIP